MESRLARTTSHRQAYDMTWKDRTPNLLLWALRARCSATIIALGFLGCATEVEVSQSNDALTGNFEQACTAANGVYTGSACYCTSNRSHFNPYVETCAIDEAPSPCFTTAGKDERATHDYSFVLQPGYASRIDLVPLHPDATVELSVTNPSGRKRGAAAKGWDHKYTVIANSSKAAVTYKLHYTSSVPKFAPSMECQRIVEGNEPSGLLDGPYCKPGRACTKEQPAQERGQCDAKSLENLGDDEAGHCW